MYKCEPEPEPNPEPETMAEQPNHGNRTKDIKLNLPIVFGESQDKFQKVQKCT